MAKETLTEKQIQNEIDDMKSKLDKEPKVPIYIPDDPLNADDVVPVGVNGVIYAIPRGQSFQVPKSIYEAWKYSYDNTKKANDKIKKSMDKDIVVY